MILRKIVSERRIRLHFSHVCFFPSFSTRMNIVYYWSLVYKKKKEKKNSRISPLTFWLGLNRHLWANSALFFSALTAEQFNSAAHACETYLSLIRLLVFQALLITKLAQSAVFIVIVPDCVVNLSVDMCFALFLFLFIYFFYRHDLECSP